MTRRLKDEVRVPLVATNRINDPALAEAILERGDADMVSMARPLLADPDFVVKAATGRANEINTCIACNQACLDHIFERKLASCLVNPYAGRETELKFAPAAQRRTIAVVGAGPAGLAAAIPGKEEFTETIRYFGARLAKLGVKLELGKHVECADLGNFHHVIVATGIVPRALDVPGSQHPKVASYADVVSGRRVAGSKVAIVGAGGIGFDVAELLTASSPHDGHASDGRVDDPAIAQFREEWGIDANFAERGGLGEVHEPTPARQVWLLQRKSSKVGEGLAKTTGWIKRTLLKKDAGLHVRVGGQPQLLDVDTIVVCAGQEPRRDIVDCLRSMGISHTLVGGADVAAELDAKRAIEQGTRVALSV